MGSRLSWVAAWATAGTTILLLPWACSAPSDQCPVDITPGEPCNVVSTRYCVTNNAQFATCDGGVHATSSLVACVNSRWTLEGPDASVSCPDGGGD